MQKSEPSRPDRPTVFLSYSQRDKRWLEALRTMLAPSVRGGIVDVWWDGEIKPSQAWREEIDKALASANIALLLISPNFLASDFIAQGELPYLIKAAREQRVALLWVLLSPCLYEQTPLNEIQAAHDVSRPLDSLRKPERTAVWKEICQRIIEAAGGVPASGGIVTPAVSIPDDTPPSSNPEGEAVQPRARHWWLAAVGLMALVLLTILILSMTFKEPQTLYREGLAALAIGEEPRAKQLLQNSLARREDPLVRSALAKTLALLGEQETAVEESKRAFAHIGNLPDEQKLLVEARTAEVKKRWAEAGSLYERLANQYPRVVEYKVDLVLSTCKAKAKSPDDAWRYITATEGTVASDPRILLIKAKLAYSRGEFEEASQAANQVISKGIQGFLAEAFLLRAIARHSLDESDLPLDDLKKAEEFADSDSLHENIQEAAGNFYYLRGELDKAAESYGRALDNARSKGDKDGEGRYRTFLSNIDSDRGRLTKALRGYEESIPLLNHEEEKGAAIGNLGFLRLSLGDLRGASENLREAREIFRGRDVEKELLYLCNFGFVQLEALELDSATKSFVECRRRAQIPQTKATALSGLSGVLLYRGDLPGAVAKLREVSTLQTGPDLAKTQLNLARVRFEQGFFEQGLLSEAADLCIKARGSFSAHERPMEHALIQVLLARIDLSRGNLQLAKSKLDRVELDEGYELLREDFELYSQLSFARAYLLAQMGDSRVARDLMDSIHKVAVAKGHLRVELDASLILAEIAGDRDQLSTVAGMAKENDYGLVENKARHLLEDGL